MSDPFEKVASGEPLVFKADTWNMLLDAARFYRERFAGRKDGPHNSTDPLVPAALIWIKNTTGGSLLAHSPVVSSGATPIDPTTKPLNARRQPVLETAAPAAATDTVLITQGPISSGKIGLAAVAGVTVAAVNVSDSGHRFARPIVGNTTSLESANAGPVQILGPFDTGNATRLVLLGFGAGGDETDAIVADCGYGCGWWAGMLDTWCAKITVLSAEGECSTIDTDQNFEMRGGGGSWRSQKWDDDLEDWVDVNFVYGGGEGVAILTIDEDGPHLTINGIELIRDCCGIGTAQFSGGSQLGLCDGTPPVMPCALNTFRVRIACQCCSIAGWEGPGYYCINNDDDECEIVPLDEDDRCDDTIEILDGPFDTPEDACDSEACADCCEVTECPTPPLPTPVTATVTVTSGGCAADGQTTSASAIGMGDSFPYTGEFECGASFQVSCVDGVWSFTHSLLFEGCHFRKTTGGFPGVMDDGVVLSASPLHVRFYGEVNDNPLAMGPWCPCYIDITE